MSNMEPETKAMYEALLAIWRMSYGVPGSGPGTLLNRIADEALAALELQADWQSLPTMDDE